MIPDDERGVIYSDSPKDVALDIIPLLDSPERLRKIGEDGFSYVSQVHSYESITGQLEGFIKEATIQLR